MDQTLFEPADDDECEIAIELEDFSPNEAVERFRNMGRRRNEQGTHLCTMV
jgi:hypothetical protein